MKVMSIRRCLLVALIASASGCASSPDTAGSAGGTGGTGGTGGNGGSGISGGLAVGGSTAGTSAGAGMSLGGNTAAGASGSGGGGSSNAGDAGNSGSGGIIGAGGEAGSAGQANNGCGASQLLCDDFESKKLDQFKLVETGGKLSIDTTHVYSGAASVLLTIPANQRGGFLEAAGAPLFPLEHNTVFGRLMLYLEDLPDGHFDTVRAGPVGGGTPWYNIGGQYKAMLMNYYSGPLDCYGTVDGKPLLPLKKWVCWEFQYDGEKNSMTLWVDGALSHSITGQGNGCVGGKQGTWQAPEFGSVRLGQFNAQTAGNQTRIWMDDIALGTAARIGCPAVSAGAH
jgi:hypothetical protein